MSGFVLNYANVKSWAERVYGKQLRYNDEAGQLGLPHTVLDIPVWLVFIPRPERGMLTMALTMPFTVPAERFVPVGGALTLLNARSYMGAWILNPDKGEIAFRITVPALDVSYTDSALRFVAGVVASSAEAMARPLYAVAQQGASADTVASAAATLAAT
jgi:hypothetical protein